MAQDQSDLLEGNAVPQHLGGRGMAKEVSTFRRCFDTSTSQSPLHHVRHTIGREERLKRGNVPLGACCGVLRRCSCRWGSRSLGFKHKL